MRVQARPGGTGDVGVRVGFSTRLFALGYKFVAPLRANHLGVAVYGDEGKVGGGGVKSFVKKTGRQSL